MQKIYFIALFLGACSIYAHAQQSFTCKDTVVIAMDDDCNFSHNDFDIGLFCNCPSPNNYFLELDGIAPYHDGPWTPAYINRSSIGQTYGFRVVGFNSIICKGILLVRDTIPPKISCPSQVFLELDSARTATLTQANAPITIKENCATPAQTIMTFDNRPSATYTCDHLGEHNISIKVADPYGNTAICQTMVSVSDPLGFCTANCPSKCPNIQNITFTAAYDTLLPALRSGDLSKFETFGFPIFDTLCPIKDTLYAVSYTTSPAGPNWFTRSWEVRSDTAPPRKCLQRIVFPATRVLSFNGQVFWDTIQNCIRDAAEPGEHRFSVTATKLPSYHSTTATLTTTGNYTLPVTIGPMDSLLILHVNLPNGLATTCPTTISVPARSGPSAHNANFGFYAPPHCPFLTVDVSEQSIYPCYDYNRFTIQYCNQSAKSANNAYLTLTLDTLLSITIATKTYTRSGNTYTFQLGQLPGRRCDKFWVDVKADCAIVSGQTKCVEATIYPNSPCHRPWGGYLLKANASCLGDSIRLSLFNTGSGMRQASQYTILRNGHVYRNAPFQLRAKETLYVTVPADGSTWRIYAPQDPNHPLQKWASASIDMCEGPTSGGTANIFPPNDPKPYSDMVCTTIFGSALTIPDNTNPEHQSHLKESIATDTVFRTLGDPYLLASTKPSQKFPTLQLSVAPNPFQEQAILTATGHTLRDGQLFLYDGQGRLLRTQRFQGNQCTLERGDLNSGVYFLRITDHGAFIGTGTVVVR